MSGGEFWTQPPSQPSRSIVKINGDGTWRIEPDATDEEIRKVLPVVVRKAADWCKQVTDIARGGQGNLGKFMGVLVCPKCKCEALLTVDRIAVDKRTAAIEQLCEICR